MNFASRTAPPIALPPTTAERVADGLGGRRTGANKYLCRCPAHDDRTPSLSVTEAPDGKVLVHCHAGCAQQEVIEELRGRGLWSGSPQGLGPEEIAHREARAAED